MSHLLSFGQKRVWKKAVLPMLAGLWLMALVPGVRYLLAYEATAGAQGSVAKNWPAGVPKVGESGLATMVVALHPRCSCSAATLSELEEAAEKTGGRFQTVLYVYAPAGGDFHWRDVALYAEAQKRLHATVLMDEDGRYARAFGAMTSGEVLYYSAARGDGRRELLFNGGVTAGRGMVEENVGIARLKAVMERGGRVDEASTPVFGCGLFGTASKDSETKKIEMRGTAQ